MKKTKLLKYLKFMGKKTTQKTLRIMYWKLSKNCVVDVVISIALYITIIKVVLAEVALSISPLVKWVSPESKQLYHPWENFLEKKGRKHFPERVIKFEKRVSPASSWKVSCINNEQT